VLLHPDLRGVARIRAFVYFVGRELGQLRALIEGRAPLRGRAAARHAK
jgi:hypothetical protein